MVEVIGGRFVQDGIIIEKILLINLIGCLYR
jgi:hypothetical protein